MNCWISLKPICLVSGSQEQPGTFLKFQHLPWHFLFLLAQYLHLCSKSSCTDHYGKPTGYVTLIFFISKVVTSAKFISKVVNLNSPYSKNCDKRCSALFLGLMRERQLHVEPKLKPRISKAKSHRDIYLPARRYRTL